MIEIFVFGIANHERNAFRRSLKKVFAVNCKSDGMTREQENCRQGPRNEPVAARRLQCQIWPAEMDCERTAFRGPGPGDGGNEFRKEANDLHCVPMVWTACLIA